ncbi:MAG TPA: hypothetical protein VLA89_18500 [Gemmatimonadales bacterium]|nr:hypothetical protein [Gemmatimonadales bacterium]
MILLLDDHRSYSKDYEKLCICWPEVVARFETADGPLFVWVDMGGARVKVTSQGWVKQAWGGFDDIAESYGRLVREALKDASPSSRPGPFLAPEEFAVERDSLPYLEPPVMLSKEEGVRMVAGRAATRTGESKIRVRLTPGSHGASARLSGGESVEQRERLEALLKRLATKPALRSGKPMSCWVDLVYPAD